MKWVEKRCSEETVKSFKWRIPLSLSLSLSLYLSLSISLSLSLCVFRHYIDSQLSSTHTHCVPVSISCSLHIAVSPLLIDPSSQDKQLCVDATTWSNLKRTIVLTFAWWYVILLILKLIFSSLWWYYVLQNNNASAASYMHSLTDSITSW